MANTPNPRRFLPSLSRATVLVLGSAALLACKSENAATMVKPSSPPANEQPAVVADTEQSGEQNNIETVDVQVMPMPEPSEGDAAFRSSASRVAKVQAEHTLRSMQMPEPMRNEPVDRENYASVAQSSVKLTQSEPVSTFSIDVDTGAYSNVRRILNEGRLPPGNAVRVEEMINYFGYAYAPPASTNQPFSVSTEVAPTPWNPETLLMQVGIKGFEIPVNDRPASNLVFLLDVSGSMGSTNKLPLLKNAFRLLTDNLNDNDSVSIVVYAGASGVVLEPTPGGNRHAILAALNQLRAGGSTNGAAGIRLAYDMARSAYIEGGINRVILATDGDFNVGTVNFDALISLIEQERESGVSLTTLGFGTGNYNDKLMEQVADAGNGNYAYIDTLSEARKVLVDELGSTLHTIAKDVKIQVEFNPAQVAEYRLIGYENRALKREDFNNDKVDAGEIGAGHTVTAIYELTPTDSPARLFEPLRYGQADTTASNKESELAFVRLRYKAPDGDRSKLIEFGVQGKDVVKPQATSDDFRFAAAVAAFGQQLKGGRFTQDYALDETAALASSALGKDRHGYRREFIELVDNARALAGSQRVKISASDTVRH